MGCLSKNSESRKILGFQERLKEHTDLWKRDVRRFEIKAKQRWKEVKKSSKELIKQQTIKQTWFLNWAERAQGSCSVSWKPVVRLPYGQETSPRCSMEKSSLFLERKLLNAETWQCGGK